MWDAIVMCLYVFVLYVNLNQAKTPIVCDPFILLQISLTKVVLKMYNNITFIVYNIAKKIQQVLKRKKCKPSKVIVKNSNISTLNSFLVFGDNLIE